MLDKRKYNYLKIICILKDYDYGWFNVCIYNSNGDKVFDTNVKNNTAIKFPICISDIYRIQVCPNKKFTPMCINSWITLRKHKNYCKYFCFNIKESCKHKVHLTLNLTDQNYTGLPISRGIISLWQNIM